MTKYKKKKNKQQHDDNALRQPSYKQTFVSDGKLKDLLTQLKDEEIAKEFDVNSPQCILSKIMIDQFVKQKPKDMDKFKQHGVRFLFQLKCDKRTIKIYS